MNPKGAVDASIAASPESRIMFRQEMLILEVTQSLWESMEAKGVSRSDLADRLKKSRGFVTQILSGSRNLTLRTLADVVGALGCRVQFKLLEGVAEEVEPVSATTLSWATFRPEPKWEQSELRMNTEPPTEAEAA